MATDGPASPEGTNPQLEAVRAELQGRSDGNSDTNGQSSSADEVKAGEEASEAKVESDQEIIDRVASSFVDRIRAGRAEHQERVAYPINEKNSDIDKAYDYGRSQVSLIEDEAYILGKTEHVIDKHKAYTEEDRSQDFAALRRAQDALREEMFLESQRRGGSFLRDALWFRQELMAVRDRVSTRDINPKVVEQLRKPQDQANPATESTNQGPKLDTAASSVPEPALTPAGSGISSGTGS